MSIPKQETNWKEKGFGWIPDLPDITDPSLPTALNNEIRILTQEGTSHVEEVAGDVIDLLEKSGLIEKEKIDEIRQKLLGETFFPSIKIYKTLRKGVPSSVKQILQLKQAFYSIYLTAENNFKEKLKKAYGFPDNKDVAAGESVKLIQWLQEPVFDDQLEQLVKTFQHETKLLEDGIVGLRTYTKLRLFLSGEKDKDVKVNLLCPSTLIPNEILDEINSEYKRIIDQRNYIISTIEKNNSTIIKLIKESIRLPKLEAYLEDKYGQVKKTSFVCHICERAFENRSGLASHLKAHNKKENINDLSISN
jgi:peptidoglycan hydrolase-like protein with peptidoglycan-binding domain